MSGLTVKNISKSFGPNQVLTNISFTMLKGEIVALLGPSGCGKSTLLNIIAGLEKPDLGEITWDQEVITHLPVHKRNFGLMFQDFMLFPHKNVGGNIAFGLEMSNWSKKEIDERIQETLDIVKLSDYAHRDVGTLSGGEQQRVALARSLAPQPRLLMLDEPLGALDRVLRDRLLVELEKILQVQHQTALYVTHDQEEAFMLADRIVVMNQGHIAQIGTPQTIFQKPASQYVARFLGLNNIIQAHVQGELLISDIGTFKIPGLENWLTTTNLPINDMDNIHILFRPDAMRLDGGGSIALKGKIENIKYRGNLCRIITKIEGQSLTFEFPSSIPIPQIGHFLEFSFNPDQAIQFLL